MTKHEVIYMDPHDLVPHEVNQSIYRDAPDDEFIESIRRLGVLEPILAMQPAASIDSDGGVSVRPTVVLSGHRRMNAARALDIDEVPVIIQPDELVQTDDDAIRLLILSNRQRDKTNEQRAREFAILKEVEERLARERLASVTEGEKVGRASDIAAEAVGMSGRTADRAVTVVEAIDDAEASGDQGRASDAEPVSKQGAQGCRAGEGTCCRRERGCRSRQPH